jgi:thiol-disulfide isomerase/thioredoxin
MMKKDMMMKDDGMKKDSMMDKKDTMMKDDMMKVKGSYETYAPEKVAWAKKGKVVLFFHAGWCPTCKAADTAITTSAIPEGVFILKTDYDTYTALKQKYGVTYQHTFVQVDAEGNQVVKWSGSSSLADILAKLQ